MADLDDESATKFDGHAAPTQASGNALVTGLNAPFFAGQSTLYAGQSKPYESLPGALTQTATSKPSTAPADEGEQSAIAATPELQRLAKGTVPQQTRMPNARVVSQLSRLAATPNSTSPAPAPNSSSSLSSSLAASSLALVSALASSFASASAPALAPAPEKAEGRAPDAVLTTGIESPKVVAGGGAWIATKGASAIAGPMIVAPTLQPSHVQPSHIAKTIHAGPLAPVTLASSVTKTIVSGALTPERQGATDTAVSADIVQSVPASSSPLGMLPADSAAQLCVQDGAAIDNPASSQEPVPDALQITASSIATPSVPQADRKPKDPLAAPATPAAQVLVSAEPSTSQERVLKGDRSPVMTALPSTSPAPPTAETASPQMPTGLFSQLPLASPSVNPGPALAVASVTPASPRAAKGTGYSPALASAGPAPVAANASSAPEKSTATQPERSQSEGPSQGKEVSTAVSLASTSLASASPGLNLSPLLHATPVAEEKGADPTFKQSFDAHGSSSDLSLPAGGRFSQEPVTLVSTPNVLEVGVSSGTNGWLKVRAELDGTGAVNASVVASSTNAAEALHKELPAMSAYLKDESIGVSALVVTRSEAAGGIQDAAMSFGPGGDGGRRGQDTTYFETASLAAGGEELPTGSARLNAAPSSLEESRAASLNTGFSSGSGAWLNVLA